MDELISVQLKPLTDAEIPMVLRWRNHPLVRKVMFSDHEISLDEHLAWWKKTCDDSIRQDLLFYYNGQPRGVIYFFDIDLVEQRCHWGFYLDSEQLSGSSEQLKIWLALEQSAINYAFETLAVQSLICETFEFNRAVHQIHKKFGFKEINRISHEKDGQDEIVVVMALKKESTGQECDVSVKAVSIPPVLQLAFLGSANWELVGREFVRLYSEAIGENAEIFPIPFGQYRHQIWDEKSELLTNKLDYYVFCERLEDLYETPFTIFDFSKREALEQHFNEYCHLIKNARDRLTGTFFVLDFVPVKPFLSSLEEASYESESVLGFVESLNTRLEQVCNNIPDCFLVRLSALVGRFGANFANPGKYWYLARSPFSATFATELNREILKFILVLRGQTARVVVVDLDNTLWGGGIGDDGLDGVNVGGDFPGNVFVEIQQTLKSLRGRGMALAICSKNTETVAQEVFQKHPSMVLKLGDFTSTRINWRDKTENLREIAAEIGVGLSSLCFLDDSPYERDAVRQMLPEVIVPELPQDITLWSSFILSCPHLAAFRPTQEDLKRVKNYEIRAKIKNDATTFKEKEDYWRSLGMKLFFYQYGKTNKQRVLQLLSKTNQFNMTTRRHAEKDLELLVSEGADIIPIGLADKYSDEEIIGLIILIPTSEVQTMVIETFLLSCRVLGRSVETGILGWICTHLSKRGITRLEGLFFETERNLPAASVYKYHGFEAVDPSRFRLSLKTSPVVQPEWFQFSEEAPQ
ncbi:MAG: UDP-4-amino-4,6-dideoxy-N-acetyl-beta-L-altrosamine N-acetyltransferase [Candidatus Zixiibacteriota bacterium]|nr:MAG: UDP-4-amino-4,6-dideoxy-N-acetyl-beta-L-altrosamine N-acetyltransferase [candidate division Zixibacteria bacterium]